MDIWSFLKEFYKIKDSDINNFNRFRILRNKVVYKAKIVSIEVCEESFEFLVYFLSLLGKEFDKEIKWIYIRC